MVKHLNGYSGNYLQVSARSVIRPRNRVWFLWISTGLGYIAMIVCSNPRTKRSCPVKSFFILLYWISILNIRTDDLHAQALHIMTVLFHRSCQAVEALRGGGFCVRQCPGVSVTSITSATLSRIHALRFLKTRCERFFGNLGVFPAWNS